MSRSNSSPALAMSHASSSVDEDRTEAATARPSSWLSRAPDPNTPEPFEFVADRPFLSIVPTGRPERRRSSVTSATPTGR
jgi:hypothetical protein